MHRVHLISLVAFVSIGFAGTIAEAATLPALPSFTVPKAPVFTAPTKPVVVAAPKPMSASAFMALSKKH